jgi:hypothetical protein
VTQLYPPDIGFSFVASYDRLIRFGTDRTENVVPLLCNCCLADRAENVTYFFLLLTGRCLQRAAVELPPSNGSVCYNIVRIRNDTICVAGRRARVLVAAAWSLSALFSVPIFILYEERLVQGEAHLLPYCSL